MSKIKELQTGIKKYNFDEALKILDLYENDYINKGYFDFEVYKFSASEEKMIKITKIVICVIITLSFLFISSFLYRAFSQAGFNYFIMIFFAFMIIAIVLCLIFPDKTKYVKSVRISENDITIKLQDSMKVKEKVYKYDFKSCSLSFKRHYYRRSDDSTEYEDGMNIIINGNKFFIKNIYKCAELNVFSIYAMALKNGNDAREELANIYKW